MPEKMLCHGCIGDTVLSAEVRKTGTKARCYHCERGRKAWPLNRLAERIHGVLHANYHAVYPSPYDHYAFESSGEDAALTITELAGLDDTNIGEDIREILSDRYGYSAQRDGGDDQYGSDVGYEFHHADTTHLHLSWTGFCELLKTRSRFFNSQARGMLDDIFTNLHELNAGKGRPVIRSYGAARPTRFFRGRVATDLFTLERILVDPVRELAAPPHNLARVGRMNARGISLLYGAMDIETCLAELRPPVGSHVVVTAFQNVRPLRLLDLGRLRSVSVGGSMFADEFRERYELAGFLSRLVNELSRPIMPGSEEMDYLPTQAVAEYLADREDLELDGLLFPSSQQIDGALNVVLFHRASRAMGKKLPAGAQTSMLGPKLNEDGEPDGVTVWIRLPAKKRRKTLASRDTILDVLFEPVTPILSADEDDGDWRVATLKWVPDSLEVYAIKQVDYAKDRHTVKRSIESRPKRQKFRRP